MYPERIKMLKYPIILFVVIKILIPESCYSFEPDYDMDIFTSEQIIDTGFHTRTKARWVFKINDSNLIITGIVYLSRTDSNFIYVFDKWDISLHISKIDDLLNALIKGKEWSAVANNNKIANFSKEIDMIGTAINLLFRVRDNKGYIYIQTTKWPHKLELECKDQYKFIKDVDELILAFDNYSDRYKKHNQVQDEELKKYRYQQQKISEEKQKINDLFN